MEQYVLEIPQQDLQLLVQHNAVDNLKYLDDDDRALAIWGFACSVRHVGSCRRVQSTGPSGSASTQLFAIEGTETGREYPNHFCS